MTRTMPALLGATLLSLSLTACSFFQKRSQSRENVYQKSTEARPLEVPPGLDMPNSSAALVIPTPAAAPAGDTVAAGEAPATSISPAAGNEALPPGAPTTALGGVSLSGDGLKVADTPESTWSRVGLALIRSGAATIVSSDKQGLSYEIESTGVRTEKAGWFKRAITFGNADKEVATRVGLKVRIEADGDASRVRIEGDGGEASRDAAADILEALRRRLS